MLTLKNSDDDGPEYSKLTVHQHRDNPPTLMFDATSEGRGIPVSLSLRQAIKLRDNLTEWIDAVSIGTFKDAELMSGRIL